VSSLRGDVLPLLLTRAGYESDGAEVACDVTMLLVAMLLVDGPSRPPPMDGKLLPVSVSSLFRSRTEQLLAVDWLAWREWKRVSDAKADVAEVVRDSEATARTVGRPRNLLPMGGGLAAAAAGWSKLSVTEPATFLDLEANGTRM
jgi:hypothetical protein